MTHSKRAYLLYQIFLVGDWRAYLGIWALYIPFSLAFALIVGVSLWVPVNLIPQMPLYLSIGSAGGYAIAKLRRRELRE